MKSLIARLLVFFLGIPAVIALIAFLPQYNSIGVSLVVCLFAGLGGVEVSGFFHGGQKAYRRILSFAIAAAPPLLEYLNSLQILPRESLSLVAALFVLIVMASQAFCSAEGIAGILERVSALFFPLIYPGILSMFLVRIGSRGENAAYLYFLFFAATFSNDSAAWLFGMLLGKKRNIVPVSPNKSLAGFIGGMAASLAAPVILAMLLPDRYPGQLWRYVTVGFGVGAAVILGDLAESGLKRSAGVKDSGNVIPGRGGILDSIDSLLFAAPVFILLYRILFATA